MIKSSEQWQSSGIIIAPLIPKLSMDIIIQSLGFKAGDSLEAFVTEKLNNLKSDHIVRANVTLFLGPQNNPEHNYCEIRLEVPGNDHFVKKSGVHFETAVSECVEVLESMIKKSRDKDGDRKKADAVAIQEEILQGEDDQNPG